LIGSYTVLFTDLNKAPNLHQSVDALGILLAATAVGISWLGCERAECELISVLSSPERVALPSAAGRGAGAVLR
jgi:hypothetical protein